MNDGDETLEVTNIKGSCDCFAGFEGEKVLAPGEGGELIIKFDKSKIESGPIKRMVRFETNDPANKLVRVNFSFEIERTDSEEIRWLRKDLTAIKHQLHLLRADMRKVLAAILVATWAVAASEIKIALEKAELVVKTAMLLITKHELREAESELEDLEDAFDAKQLILKATQGALIVVESQLDVAKSDYATKLGDVEDAKEEVSKATDALAACQAG